MIEQNAEKEASFAIKKWTEEMSRGMSDLMSYESGSMAPEMSYHAL